MPHDPIDAGIVEALSHLGTLRIEATRQGDLSGAACIAAAEAAMLLLWEQCRQLRARVDALERQGVE